MPNDLGPDESELEGHWISRDGRVVGDEACERVEWLTKHRLQELARDASGWETLFIDPRDGRLWERTYRTGEWHGGGPPSLQLIVKAAALKKYRLPESDLGKTPSGLS